MSTTEAPPGAAPPGDEVDVVALAADVDRARRAADALDPEARDAALELQSAVEAFHRGALVHMVRALRADPRGAELLFELVDDPGVRAVFTLHGIIRADPRTRAETALAAVRPHLQSHGGDVDLVELDGGTAVVRLQGSCSGCSMSAVTLREVVEEALVSGVEEITGVRVLDDEPTTAFIPLGSVGRRPGADTGWVVGPTVDSLAPGTVARVDAGPDSYVVTRVDGRVSAFRNQCVHQGSSLDGGRIADGVLTCPWHGFTFDASTGECLSAPGAQLEQVPARVEDDTIWLRVGDG